MVRFSLLWLSLFSLCLSLCISFFVRFCFTHWAWTNHVDTKLLICYSQAHRYYNVFVLCIIINGIMPSLSLRVPELLILILLYSFPITVQLCAWIVDLLDDFLKRKKRKPWPIRWNDASIKYERKNPMTLDNKSIRKNWMHIKTSIQVVCEFKSFFVSFLILFFFI